MRDMLLFFNVCEGEEVPQYRFNVALVSNIDSTNDEAWDVALTDGWVCTLEGEDLDRFRKWIEARSF